jgi:hypothetical protein
MKSKETEPGTKSNKMKNNLLFVFLLSGGALLAQQAAEPLSNDSLAKEVNALKADMAKAKKLKITGWIQAQFQVADSNGVANFDGGNFPTYSDKRFMIRRARVKFTYGGANTTAVLQINGTERGLNLVEAYGIYTFPFLKSLAVSAGVMNRPFGFEIEQSSSVRESPERSRYTQIVMPNERDLGAKLIFAPLKGTALHGLRLDAGFYNGQGIYVPAPNTPGHLAQGFPAGTIPVLGLTDFDYGKDFIGRLSYYKDLTEKLRVGLGTSHYNGLLVNQSNAVYDKIEKDTSGILQWKAADTTNGAIFKGKSSKRMYYGVEAFVSVKSILGTTTLRGEYIAGTQPGTVSSSQSPFYLPSGNFTLPGTAVKVPLTSTFLRNFNGMYVYFIQRIAKTRHEVVLKYEWYDPNTAISGADILGAARNGFTAADVKYTQLGLGYNYWFDEHAMLMLYYNIITNETTGDGTTALAGFQKDIKDNIFTLRIQYKF